MSLVTILLVLASLAVVSYLANLGWLRNLILVFSVIYLGIFRATFFSIFHMAGLLLWKVPQFRYNPSWWVVVGIVLVLGLLLGRIWCGYLCPFGALQELLYRIIPLKIETHPAGDRRMRFIKYIFLGVIIIIFFLTAKINLSNYEPYTVLFGRSGSLFGWILVCFVLGEAAVVNRFWCRYFCLAGAVLSIVSRPSLVRLKRIGDCGGCNLCLRGCDMGAFDAEGGPEGFECIRCSRCRGLCKDNLVKLRIWRREQRRRERRFGGTKRVE